MALYGIQGGKGSHNEDAFLGYWEKNPIPNAEIRYYDSTKQVLEALKAGEIDFAQFALCNSIGGGVDESIEQLGRYSFEVVNFYEHTISHNLIAVPGVTLSDIDVIIAHSQAIRQSKDQLKKLTPQAMLQEGESEGLSHAKVASLLASGALPSTTATVGSERLAKIFNLEVLSKKLEGDRECITTFLLVTKSK